MCALCMCVYTYLVYEQEFVCICVCVVLISGLVGFLEAKEILADEQNGFRRNRGCRDQIVSLFLIGQLPRSQVG